MFEGFESRQIDSGEANIFLRHGGDGPPLLLLHGNPQTHVCWNKIANRLAERFHVVAPDLRGYGDSSAPETDEKHTPYTFRAMAAEQVRVMEALGYREFLVAGHDRGARTTHRMVVDHPERVLKAALLDILPNYHIWTNASRQWAMKSWHWLFMAQPAPLPEHMLGSVDPAWFMEKKLSKPGIGLDYCKGEPFNEYVRCFNEKTIHASCEDYRACATTDLEVDTADAENGVTCDKDILVLWGAKSHTGTVYGDILPIWRKWCPKAIGAALNCGHYVPEEAPEETLKWFLEFFGE